MIVHIDLLTTGYPSQFVLSELRQTAFLQLPSLVHATARHRTVKM